MGFSSGAERWGFPSGSPQENSTTDKTTPLRTPDSYHSLSDDGRTVGGLTTRSDHKVGGGSVPQKNRSEGARTTRSDPTQGRRGLWAAQSISFQQFGPFFDGSKVETSK